MTPTLIHCVGLAALASSASAFAQPAAAAPLTSPVSDGPSADSVDGLASVALPNTPTGLSGTATLTQTWPESAQTSRPPDFPRDHVGSPRRSALRERPPQPAVQSGSDGNVLTFFVGGEPVAPLTDDQTLDVILGTSQFSAALPVYDYAPDVQQQAQVQVRDRTSSIDMPGISTGVLDIRVIGGLAGVGLLAMVVLFAVGLKCAANWHVRPVRGSEGKGGEEREHRRAYAEPLAFNNVGASSNEFALLGLRHPFTRQDVQRAFRAKSLTAHPDHGGDADFFRSLMSARDRALADADGEEPTPGALPS